MAIEGRALCGIQKTWDAQQPDLCVEAGGKSKAGAAVCPAASGGLGYNLYGVGMLGGQVQPAAMIGIILAVFAVYGGLQWFYSYRRQTDDVAYTCMRLDHHHVPNCCKGT